jgi:hypothetical protein
MLKTAFSLSGSAVAQKLHSASMRPISQCERPHPGQRLTEFS